MQNFGKFCLENAICGTFDVEISLAKGIVFTKIGLANGAILKLWAAHPYPKFSQEPPPLAKIQMLIDWFLALVVNRWFLVVTVTLRLDNHNGFKPETSHEAKICVVGDFCLNHYCPFKNSPLKFRCSLLSRTRRN